VQTQTTQDPMGDAAQMIEAACRAIDWPKLTKWVADWLNEQYMIWTQTPERMALLDFQALLTTLQDIVDGEPMAGVENRLAHHIDRMGRQVPAIAY
jgi:biotin-(acetyl-CoA carboxylase) ligase